MKSKILLALLLVFCVLLTGCSAGESADGTLKITEIYGTYEGSGSTTKYEVERIEDDLKNQRYLFITGDARETQDKISQFER